MKKPHVIKLTEKLLKSILLYYDVDIIEHFKETCYQLKKIYPEQFSDEIIFWLNGKEVTKEYLKSVVNKIKRDYDKRKRIKTGNVG